MKKPSETAKRTRQFFMDAFCQIYSKKPLEKITVQEVAKRAGYNRCTFYQYFLDLDDLLSCVENELLRFIVEKRRATGMDKRSFISDLVELYETKALYFSALLGEYTSSRFLKQLKELQDKEAPRLHVPANSKYGDYLKEFRFYGALSLFRLWIRRKKDLSPEEFLEMIARLYENGISAFDKVKGSL